MHFIEAAEVFVSDRKEAEQQTEGAKRSSDWLQQERHENNDAIEPLVLGFFHDMKPLMGRFSPDEPNKLLLSLRSLESSHCFIFTLSRVSPEVVVGISHRPDPPQHTRNLFEKKKAAVGPCETASGWRQQERKGLQDEVQVSSSSKERGSNASDLQEVWRLRDGVCKREQVEERESID
ncbi:hypothetical protein EYF80_059961 [Liparis tanakae]|uniref:Uncharacterized protein n=1 Tax=Liparis tanakae TaxID=230148 RepID=A0A4Z2EM80_9TELE|nr:hypothetical protein EYF80_059961 [Liparis tanakae]